MRMGGMGRYSAVLETDFTCHFAGIITSFDLLRTLCRSGKVGLKPRTTPQTIIFGL